MNLVCASKCKSKKKKRLVVFLIIISLILFGVFLYINIYVNPIIIQTNQAVIKATTINVINDSVSSSISKDNFDDLLQIHYDNDGNITAITANSLLANRLNNTIINDCQTALSDIKKLNFSVPLGTFSGIKLLNGVGPSVSIKMMPVGNVETKFFSEFSSQGINQTNHKLYLNINANISVLLPGIDTSIKVKTQILLCESVIVGKVPQVYLGNNNVLNNQLNLVP